MKIKFYLTSSKRSPIEDFINSLSEELGLKFYSAFPD